MSSDLLAAQTVLVLELCGFFLQQLDVPPTLGNLLVALGLLPRKHLRGPKTVPIRLVCSFEAVSCLLLFLIEGSSASSTHMKQEARSACQGLEVED